MAFKMKGWSAFPQKMGMSEKEQQEAANKTREEEKRLLDETTRKREEQGKVTATINPAFKKKLSPFDQITEDEKKKIAENQDPGSGRSKKEEMAHDMRVTKKEIKRFEKEGNNKAIGMLKSALERQKKAYIELYGKLPGMGTFE